MRSLTITLTALIRRLIDLGEQKSKNKETKEGLFIHSILKLVLETKQKISKSKNPNE